LAQKFPVRNDKETAWRVIDEQAIILSLGDHQIRGLNPVGTRIWELADGATSLDQIGRIISGEFEIGQETAREDAEDFVHELAAKEIIFWKSP
jgi:hypothetical protein